MKNDYQNPETVKKILKNHHTIAVVGLSDKPDRPSYRVASYLQSHGYRIVPINPRISRALDEDAYPDLDSVPFEIDVADIFRRSEEVLPIIDKAVKKGVKAVWMQEGVISPDAAEKASEAGIDVVMDLCMLKEHSRYSR